MHHVNLTLMMPKLEAKNVSNELLRITFNVNAVEVNKKTTLHITHNIL